MDERFIGPQLQKLRKDANARYPGEFTQKEVSSKLSKAQSWVSNIEKQTKDGDYTIAELVKYLNLFTTGQLGEARGDDSSLTGILRRQLGEIDDTISCLLWRFSVGGLTGDNLPDPVRELGSILLLLRDLKVSLLPKLEERERELDDGAMNSDKPAGDALLNHVRNFLGAPCATDYNPISVGGTINVPRVLIKNSVDQLLGRL
ncbi:MAG: hypothetical protein MJY93_01570 [Fibrobacter sp.]|nr:hypothetical protein [Fibrobacter sp.]